MEPSLSKRLFYPKLTFAEHARHARSMMFFTAGLTFFAVGLGDYGIGAAFSMVLFTVWSFVHGFRWREDQFDLLKYIGMMSLAGAMGILLPLLIAGIVLITASSVPVETDVFLLECVRLAVSMTVVCAAGSVVGLGVRFFPRF